MSFEDDDDDDDVVATFLFCLRELIASADDVLGFFRDFLPFVDDEDEDEVGPDPADAAAEMAVEAATDLDRTELRLLAARVTTIMQLQEELVAA